MLKLILVKFKEALLSVLPITLLIVVINFTFVHIPDYSFVAFIIGFVFLVLGITLFSLGADISMTSMGKRIGKKLITKQKLWLLLITSFIIGFLITIAEPDLTVLANNFPSINSWVLKCSVGVGVGLFLMLSTLRVVYNISLKKILIGGYILVFILAIIVNAIDPTFFSIAFDSGGVTTGPITVPFILAFGLGIASDTKKNEDNSFGSVAICSMGPIIAVFLLRMVLTFFNKDVSSSGSLLTPVDFNSLSNIFSFLGDKIIEEMLGVSLPIIFIVIIFLIFQITLLKISKKSLIQIFLGLLITYVGLVVFLTGAEVGFMNVGLFIGKQIATFDYRYILIPLGLIIGFFVVLAEPSVHVLTAQVEDITNGTISKKKILLSLAFGVGIAISLAMVRVLFNISLWYFIVPCYIISIILIFFVPDFFVSIAFDSGGVASGPLTSTFILPLTIGVCSILYERDSASAIINSFGVVSLVAVTPLIMIQILGLNYKIKMAKFNKAMDERTIAEEDDEIITFKRKV